MWPGIKITLDNKFRKILAYSADARETGNLNSASGTYDPSSVVDLWDGNFHNIVYIWSMDDTLSYPNSPVTRTLRQGILLVDGYQIPITTEWPGKQTPHTIVFDSSPSATYISIGGQLRDDGCSSSVQSSQVSEVFSGMIQKLAIWDRPLGPDYSTNLGTDIVVYPDSTTSILRETARINDNDLPTKFSHDPLTGSIFSAISGNLILYHKYDELQSTDNTARDYAGRLIASTTTLSGAQTNPVTGNSMNLMNCSVTDGDYEFIDIPNLDQDGVMRTGFVAFEDELGIKRKVGFINYDLGSIVLDGEYLANGSPTGGVAFLSNLGLSGLSFVSSISATNYWLKSFDFISQNFSERMILNLSASGEEMNITENPTGVDSTRGGQLLRDPAGYPTVIGLYNDLNDLVAIAKPNHSIRKDADHNIISQIRLDF